MDPAHALLTISGRAAQPAAGEQCQFRQRPSVPAEHEAGAEEDLALIRKHRFPRRLLPRLSDLRGETGAEGDATGSEGGDGSGGEDGADTGDGDGDGAGTGGGCEVVPVTADQVVMIGDSYLAVANRCNGTGTNYNYIIDSKVYKWNGAIFAEEQSVAPLIVLDCEAFEIAGEPYLVVANYGEFQIERGLAYNTDSKVYKWN